MDTTGQLAENPSLFISYCWSCRKNDVHKIVNVLQAEFRIWLDLDKIKGDDLNEAMAQGIQSADLMVCFFSNDYKASVNCSAEADYAKNQNKPILVVRLEANVKFGLKFGLMFGNRHYLTLGPDTDNPGYFDKFMQELTSAIRNIVDKNKLEIANSPEFPNKFIKRPALSNQLLPKLQHVCRDRKAGLLFLSGLEKSGKTHFLFDSVTSKSNQLRFLGPMTRLAIWLNCKKLTDAESFSEQVKPEIESQLVAFAKQKYAEITCMSDLIGYKVLLIFDDVSSSPLLEFINGLSSKLPCIAVASDFATQIMQLDPNFINTVKDDKRIDVDPLPDDKIIDILRSYRNDGKVSLSQMAAQCQGLPGVAVSLAMGSGKQPKAPSKERHRQVNFTPSGLPQQKESLAETSPPLECIEVPNFKNYYPREKDEQAVLKGVLETSKDPAKGVFLVHGGGGNGKSTLVASVLQNTAFSSYFRQKCNLQVCIWLNCYRWNKGLCGKADEDEFVQSVIEVGSQHCPRDISANWKQISHMLQHFDSKSQTVLFVLDDCFHSSVLDVFRKKCPTSPCCVITRYESSVQGNARFACKHLIGHLAEEEVVEMFETTYGLKDKLTSPQLREMAKRCGGSPLVAGLIGGMFPSRCRNYKREYDKLMSRDFGKLFASKAIANNMKTAEKTAHLLFRNAMFDLDEDEREMYFIFLLFDPVKPFRVKELAFLWYLSIEDTQEIIQALKEKALVTATKVGSQEAYMIHQILHEAAVDVAKEQLDMTPQASLTDVRMVILYRSAKLIIGDDFDRINTFLRLMDSAIASGLESLFSRILQHFEVGYFEHYASASIVKSEKRSSREDTETNALFLATKHGDVDLIKIAHSYDETQVEQKRKFVGDTALHIAAREGNFEAVEFLYEIFPDAISMQDDNGQVPLFAGAYGGNLRVVSFLYDRYPEGLKMLTKHNSTVLHAASWDKNPKVVQFLCEKFPEAISTKDYRGLTPLHRAAWTGSVEAIQYLSELCPEAMKMQDESGLTPMHTAAWLEHSPAVDYFVTHCPELLQMPDDDGEVALHMAAKMKNPEMVKAIFEQYPEAIRAQNKRGQTPVHLAAANANIEALRFLCQQDAEVSLIQNNKGLTPLHIVSQWNLTEAIKILIETCPDALTIQDKYGQTPLHLAAAESRLAAVKLLSETCPDVLTVPDKSGRTVLHVIANSGSFEGFQLLYDKCPELVGTQSQVGNTPLHEAAASGNDKLIEFIFPKFPEAVKMTGKAGRTLLHFTAQRANLKNVQLMYEAFPEAIKVQDEAGMTPLHCAVWNDDAEVVKYLHVKFPGAAEMTNKSGQTPLDMATKYDRKHVISCLAS